MAILPRLIVPLGLQSKDFMRGMKDATRGTRGLEKNTDTLGRSLRSLKRVAIAAFAGWGVQKVIRETVGSFMEFETALVRVGNVSKESLDTVTDKIRGMDESLGTATELVKGYYQVMSAGVTEPVRSMELLVQASKLGKESVIEQGEAVKGLAALMGGYADELKTAADAADTLYTIEKLGITDVGQLIPLIGDLSNMTKATGLSLDEMGAGLAQVTTAGAGTAIAVTQMRSLMTSLSKSFERLPDQIKEYSSAAEAVKKLGFEGVLKAIAEETDGNSNALQKMLGRSEAVLAFLQLSKNGFKDYEERLVAMADKTGAAEAAWSRYVKTLKSKWETLRNILTNQSILIGEQLAPAIDELVVSLSAWIKSISAEDMKDVLEGVAAGAELFATGLSAVGSAIATTVKYWNEFRKNQFKWDEKDNPKVKVKFLGEGSSIKPLSEKIDEMTMQINKFIEKTNKKSAKVTIKISSKDLKTIKKRYNELPKLSEKAWDEMQQNAEDAFKAETFASEVATEDWVENEIEKMEASEKLYKELQEQAEGWEAFSIGSTENLLEDSTIAYEGFFGGIKQGFLELEDSQKTWADHGRESILAFAADAKTGLSGFLNPLKDDFLNVSSLFSSMLDSMVGSLTDAVADMAVQWGLDAAARAGSALLGTVAGAAASEAGSSLWDAAKEYLKLSSGAWDVKKDQFAFIHEGEMVLPQNVAESFRNAESGVERAPPGGWSTMPANTGQFAESTFGAMVMDALSGMQVPSASLSGVLPGVGLKGTVGFGQDLAKQELGLTGKWAEVGDFLGSFFGGIKGGPAGAFMGGIAGAGFFDALGDVSNLRGHEALRDALEDTYGRVSAGKMVAASGLLAGPPGSRAYLDSMELLGKQMSLVDAYAASPFAASPYTGGTGYITGNQIGGYSSDVDYGTEGQGGMSGWGKHGGWLHGADSGHSATLHGSELVLNEDQVRAVRELNAGGGGGGGNEPTVIIYNYGAITHDNFIGLVKDAIRKGNQLNTGDRYQESAQATAGIEL